MQRPAQLQNNAPGKLTPIDVRLLRRRHITESGCWEYLGARSERGYGNISVGSVLDGTRQVRKVHCVAYEFWVGPVPEGLELDHLCRNTSCFNPGHLEPVTHRVNIRRAYPLGTPFKCGHLRIEGNIQKDGTGRVRCATCRHEQRRKQRRS